LGSWFSGLGFELSMSSLTKGSMYGLSDGVHPLTKPPKERDPTPVPQAYPINTLGNPLTGLNVGGGGSPQPERQTASVSIPESTPEPQTEVIINPRVIIRDGQTIIEEGGVRRERTIRRQFQSPSVRDEQPTLDDVIRQEDFRKEYEPPNRFRHPDPIAMYN
jgi:hypothetical protein